MFAATSGHSGVDRILGNLLPAILDRGLSIDLLKVRGHGPHIGQAPGLRTVDLGTSHVYTALPALMRYLRRARPRALLSDKDRVNRTALWARHLSGSATRLVVRTGSTVSVKLTEQGGLAQRSTRWFMRRFYPWADAVIVPSRGAADDLAAFASLDPALIRVVPNPVVSQQLQSLTSGTSLHPWLVRKEYPVIMGAGELCRRKDFETLIRAFARVNARRPCRLLILGDGRRRPRLERLLRDLGLEEQAALPGFVENPYAWMTRADLFVLSSTNEGFGNVLVEAMAAGTPVVSTDCPSGPREVLRDGRYGALVPVGEPVAMADAILEALGRPVSPQDLAAAVAPYTVAESARRYLEVLALD